MATYGRVHSNMREQRQEVWWKLRTHSVCVCVHVCVCVCLRAHLCSVLMCPHKHMYVNFYSKTLFVA